jgi:hypothetical protein
VFQVLPAVHSSRKRISRHWTQMIGATPEPSRIPLAQQIAGSNVICAVFLPWRMGGTIGELTRLAKICQGTSNNML